jgi:hypothetical protein
MKSGGEEESRKMESRIETQDWRSLFKIEKSIGALQFFEPEKVNGKIVVKPPMEVVQEGIVNCWEIS